MALQLLAANNAQSVLAAGISASATSLTLNTGTGALFPSPVSGTSFFKLTLIDAATGSLTEIVHVTARAGDVFTIQRGQEGTVPRAWSANDIAANMMTAGTLSYILGNFQPLDPTLTALAALVGVANKLPYFNGDDTAALTDLTQVGRDIIGKSTIADILTYLGLDTALAAKQPLDATLTALAGLTTGANKLPYFTGTDTASQTNLTSVGRDIIGKSTIADILTYLGLDTALAAKQPLDATLTALAGLTTGANKLPYFTGTDTASQTNLTSVGRDIIGKSTIADILTYLGLGDLVNALIKTNNLSDLPDKAISRGNLGVPKGVDAQMVQARVHFNGNTGDIISGFNISSITKLGVGQYTVNFTNPLPNGKYTATASAWNTGAGLSSLARIAGVDSRTATNFGVSCMDNTTDAYTDSSNIDVIVVGGI